MKTLRGFYATALVVFSVSLAAQAQTQVPNPPTAISVTAGTAYTQNFDSLANSGTANILPPPAGFAISETGTSANVDGAYTAGTGSSSTGETYSFGVAGTNAVTDRALGSLTAGTITPIRYGARFQNDTGTTITALTIQYSGEQWRGGTATTDKLDFAYSLDATSLTTGTYIDVDTLDLLTPNTVTDGTLDGNSPANRTTLTFTITGLNIPSATTFWIRWTDIDVTGSDDALSVDDFSLQVASTTAVRLSSFICHKARNGIVVKWQSGFEVNNLGFNLYRQDDNQRVLINRTLIAGSVLITAPGLSTAGGNSYSWVDPAGTADSHYYLEDIDVDGTRTLHGPVVAVTRAGAEDRVSTESRRSILLEELNAKARSSSALHGPQRGWAAPLSASRSVDEGGSSGQLAGTSSPSSQETQKTLAAMPGIKLSVREHGWYRVTQAELVSAGIDPNADMRYLQLYADGIEVPLKINSSHGSGPLKVGDSIEFYGLAMDSPSTDTRQYWLVSGTTLGKRIKPQLLKNVNSRGVLDAFEYTIERKERLLYFSGLLNGETENFFGQVINSAPVTQTLFVSHYNTKTTQPSQLEVALQGVTLQDHLVTVLFNSAQVGAVSFSGQIHRVAHFSIDSALLREGGNVVTLQSANGDTDISLIDNVRLNYAHTYQADSDYLQFTVNGRAQLRGFSVASVALLDITDPNSVQLYIPKAEKAADGYSFTFQTSEPRTLVAFTDSSAKKPASLSRNHPSNWNQNLNGADLVIISHGDFMNSVEPLALLHRNEGMSVAVVDVEDVYDEFGYGAHDPRALRDFLMWTQSHWTQAPRYVVLVGDGSFDPRNYLGNNGETDLLPARLIDTAFLETVSDDWFVDFDNDGIGELAVGRLPVRNVVEADALVSKIVNYSPESALPKALIVADQIDPKTSFSFAAASDELRSFLPSTIGVQTIYRDVKTAVTTREEIVKGINEGPLLVNFMGHGSVEVWTGDPIFSTDDAINLNNGVRLPVFVMMTCLNGYYQNPYRESLAESLIRNPTAGAIAVWASSGRTEPASQLDVNRALFRELFVNQPSRLGDAIRLAKRATRDVDVRRTWILFGDPAMRIQ